MDVDKALVVRGVSKRYGGVVALRDVSFEVDGGEQILVFGHIGSGKSTLFKCILGLVRCSGEIRVLGEKEMERIKRLVGYSPQEAVAEPEWRVASMVRYFAELRGVEVNVDKFLEDIGLAYKGSSKIRELSGGMRRLLAVASAFLGDPPVLLFDEPLNDLDVDARKAFLETLTELKKEGKTVLVASHDYSPFLHVDKVLVLNRGEVKDIIPPSDISKYV
jgi:ABC-type multidrug transport system ATPase subunit